MSFPVESEKGGLIRKKRFTEEQIVGIVSEANAEATAIEVCRRHGISEETVYCWKGGIIGRERAIAREPRVKKVKRVFGLVVLEEIKEKNKLCCGHTSPASRRRRPGCGRRSARRRSSGASGGGCAGGRAMDAEELLGLLG